MVEITAERFKGIEDFRQCLNGARMTVNGFDSNGDLSVDRANDPTAVAAVQAALEELTYPVTPTGVYDEATAAQVRQFKIDQLLAVPSGLAQHDGVTGPGTSRRLNEIFTTETPSVEDPEIKYTDRKSHYTNVALAKANDGAHAEWLPEAGFAANRARIVDLYNYYRDLSKASPELFLWAGLGRMAGGAVVGGLDADPGLIDQVVMVRIGRDIFHDLAWQHEAFQDAPGTIVELAELHDRFNVYPKYNSLGVPTYERGAPTRSYRAAWEKITSGDPEKVAEGNRDLLENEQTSIIQPHYDFLRTLAFAGLPRSFTNAVHPYHRAFLIEQPGRDVLVLEDRWSWITAGMWTNWVAAGPTERNRLVDIPFDQICRGLFGVPGRPDLLPPGGP